VNPACSFTSEEVTHLTSRIQNGGTEVVEVCFSLPSHAACLIHKDERQVNYTGPFAFPQPCLWCSTFSDPLDLLGTLVLSVLFYA
jgi:malate dehydrogenase